MVSIQAQMSFLNRKLFSSRLNTGIETICLTQTGSLFHNRLALNLIALFPDPDCTQDTYRLFLERVL